MQRVTPFQKAPVEVLAPGVSLHRMQPGGRLDPHRCVLADVPGGQVWNDFFMVGHPSQAFQMLVPDIRMPANQYWPLHWHDCWIAVVLLDGTCLVGDWWMKPGDVLISAPGLEYGPLVVGPQGCQMFEIFAQLHLSAGGYAPEYRDHPTLQGTSAVFKERSPLNRRNDGRQVLPVDGVEGLSKHRLAPGHYLSLGATDDPERGIFGMTAFKAGERIDAHRYDDWHALFITAGGLRLGDRAVGRNDILIVEPGSAVDVLEIGNEGVEVLEMARTASGMIRRTLARAPA